MKMRNKILLILGITFLFLFSVIFLTTEQIVEGSFSRLEENKVSTNVARALNALDTKTETLSSVAYDYGAWDDTFFFVLGKNDEYVNETLYPSVLTNLDTNMILFYDSSNKLYYATGVDLKSGQEKNISSLMLDHLSANTILFSHPEKHIAGIIDSPEGLMLITSHPITQSSEEEPIVGTIIFGRYLDETVIEQLEQKTQLELNMHNFDEKKASLDVDRLSSYDNGYKNLYVHPQNETVIIGTTILDDVNGIPVTILDVEMSRDVYQQGKSTVIYIFNAMLMTGVLCGIVLTILLDRSILNRISFLSSDLTDITEKGSISSRVYMEGNDELKDLANNINHMLESLENNELELLQAECENNKRMETLLSSIICGTLLIDAETHIITDVNPTAIELIGLPKEMIVGNVCSNFFYPLQKEECATLHSDMIVNKSESILLNADGKEIPVLISIVPVSLYEKSYLVESFVDMTRIKEAEKGLIESEEKFSKLSTSAQDAILMVDDNSAITFWNPAAEKIFGYSREEVMGKDVNELVAPLGYKDRCTKGFAEFKAEGKGSADGQLIFVNSRKKDGTEFPVEVSLSRFKLKNGSWNTVAIIRDVTDQKNFEEALKDAKITAEAANRAKSDFLATMSHELRTPLNSIIGFSDMILDGAVADPDKQKKYVSNISTSGKHLLSLINNILDLSKIEAGKMDMHCELFSAYVTIDEVRQLVSPLADKKGIKLEFNKDEGLQKIYADRLRFKQILFNLVSNAIKFTHPGGKITISVTKALDKAQFSVEDTGIGISEENKSKLFQPFIQLDSATTRKYEGTGLGLSLVKRFVEMQNGRIWVESALGKGTKFTFELPFGPISEEKTNIKQEISAQVEKIQPVTETSKQLPQTLETAYSKVDGSLILVVEDDTLSRELLELTLVNEGYRVASATNGKEALELARKKKPFAIILDIMMPGMNGWEVLKHLKDDKQTHNIPVIIASVIEKSELGVIWRSVEHLVKPVQKDRLLATLEKFKEENSKAVLSALVVDDEINAVELIASMLAEEGINVLPAYGGQEAIDIALKQHPDIIILDLMMPEVSGFDVIATLKASTETIDIPIIICTAKDLDPTDMRSLNENVFCIMHKGMFNREELINFVKTVENGQPNEDHPMNSKKEA